MRLNIAASIFLKISPRFAFKLSRDMPTFIRLPLSYWAH